MTTSSEPLRELAPDVLSWSRWHEEKGIAFNGFLVLDPGGNVAIDPPELEPRQLDDVWARGGVAHVVITNGHHGRRAAELVERTRAETWAPRKDVELLHVEVDHPYEGGASLPAGLVAVAIPDAKTRGECALLLPRDGGTLFVGDAIIGKTGGALAMLPDDKFKSPEKARRGLRVLLEQDFERMLLADGEQPSGGRHQLEDWLAHLGVRPRRTRH